MITLPLFERCKFNENEIVFNNKPNMTLDGCRLFSRMEPDIDLSKTYSKFNGLLRCIEY